MTCPKINYMVLLTRIGVLGLAIAAYFCFPGVQEFATEGITYLKHRNFGGLRQFILSYGLWAPVTSIALMTLQSIVPLVPGLIITISNAWIFGWKYGALYSWFGALLGAALDFGIARWYGRPVVERFISAKFLNFTDRFFKRHGIFAVFITRLVPLIPFKVISYGAGLTQLTLYEFAAATAIGQTPAIILYSILGQNLSHSVKSVVMITSLLVLAGLVVYYYRSTIERYFTSYNDK
ncbi:TVP38/TMEM64 family inner membrane protein YdjZ [Sporomusa acidovorans DSM 3132]|uniref:TVP38/TMEM64 family membrane protein n=2 Tax=Sporomusa TaxID=2375 RepID=A0ABZ3J4A7_SPOA4|nr:TVP38/TMEM64 family inner membrane protein YdjZ [Sporomusa acidovorans DSM 3132]SDD40882.1 Uncharacterized membrane protein YdjX, TVP38/TMEM64 family, SNARE-associated domain [Sporomusa acidovorans]